MNVRDRGSSRKDDKMIREIIKLPGSILKKQKYNVNMTQEEIEPYIIGIANSQMTEWLDDLRGTPTSSLETLYSDLRSKHDFKNAKAVQFISELVQVYYKTDKQFKETFKFNGVDYVWINSKGDSTNTYIRADLFNEINKRLDNGRDITVRFIPAKLNAYFGLSLSSSTRISDENQPQKVIVVRDNVSTFMANYTHVETSSFTL